MKDGYNPIQQADGGGSDSGHNKHSLLKYLAVAVVVITVAVFLPSPFVEKNKKLGETYEKEHWPPYLSSSAFNFFKRPVNTDEATALGWVKSDEPCNPNLGEPWLYKGKRSYNSSVTLYFTPAVGQVLFSEIIPGRVSAVEVDFYGGVEPSLVEKKYFSEKRFSADGAYHSLSVAFQNGAVKNLCDTSTTIEPHGEKYIAINPDGVNKTIPTKDEFSVMSSEGWKPGSCIYKMGYHWWSDTLGGADLSYKAEDTVPLVPMYFEGEMSGFFFLATNKLQFWPESCGRVFPLKSDPEYGEKMKKIAECISARNFWDDGVGLNQANIEPFYICSNVCDRNCKFTGAGFDPPTYTTMHWFVREDMNDVVCKEGVVHPYCPDNDYPILTTWDNTAN